MMNINQSMHIILSNSELNFNTIIKSRLPHFVYLFIYFKKENLIYIQQIESFITINCSFLLNLLKEKG